MEYTSGIRNSLARAYGKGLAELLNWAENTVETSEMADAFLEDVVANDWAGGARVIVWQYFFTGGALARITLSSGELLARLSSGTRSVAHELDDILCHVSEQASAWRGHKLDEEAFWYFAKAQQARGLEWIVCPERILEKDLYLRLMADFSTAECILAGSFRKEPVSDAMRMLLAEVVPAELLPWLGMGASDESLTQLLEFMKERDLFFSSTVALDGLLSDIQNVELLREVILRCEAFVQYQYIFNPVLHKTVLDREEGLDAVLARLTPPLSYIELVIAGPELGGIDESLMGFFVGRWDGEGADLVYRRELARLVPGLSRVFFDIEEEDVDEEYALDRELLAWMRAELEAAGDFDAGLCLLRTHHKASLAQVCETLCLLTKAGS